MRIFLSILLAASLYVAWIVCWQLILSANLALTAHVPLFVLVAGAGCWWVARIVWRADVHRLGQWPIEARLLAFGSLAVLLCVASFAFHAAIMGMPATSPLPAPAGVSPLFAASFSLFAPVFAGVIEEVAFRGMIQPRLSEYLGAARAIVVTSLLFTCWHFWNPLFSYQWGGYLMMSVVLGVVLAVSRSLLLCVLAHAAVNMLMNVYVLAMGSTPEDYSNKWLFVSASAMLLLAAIIAMEGRRLWPRSERRA